MHSHEAEGQSQVIISCHYGNSCLNTGNTRRRGVLIKKERSTLKKCCSVCRLPSWFTGINTVVTNYSVFLFSTHFQGCVGSLNGCGIVSPFKLVGYRIFSECFIFLFPGSSGHFVLGLLNRLPLTNFFQTVFNNIQWREILNQML